MATTDVASIQAALDTGALANGVNLVKQFIMAASTATAHYYVTGGVYAPGKAGWVTSLVSDTTANQAIDIKTQTLALYP